MTVSEMGERMSNEEYMQWLAFLKWEQWMQERRRRG